MATETAPEVNGDEAVEINSSKSLSQTAFAINGGEGVTLEHHEPSSPAALIDQHILSHPLVVKLLADSDFRASRPHLKSPASQRPQNLMNGVLLGAGRIVVPPLAFVKADGSQYFCVLYLGAGLCGHPSFVHGGLLATLMDEALAGCCFPALPNHIGVTANLQLSFKRPCKGEQYVVIKAETTKVSGKKAWVKGSLQSLAVEGFLDDSKVMVEAEALFIEPS